MSDTINHKTTLPSARSETVVHPKTLMTHLEETRSQPGGGSPNTEVRAGKTSGVVAASSDVKKS